MPIAAQPPDGQVQEISSSKQRKRCLRPPTRRQPVHRSHALQGAPHAPATGRVAGKI
jgi:hypothetical protein